MEGRMEGDNGAKGKGKEAKNEYMYLNDRTGKLNNYERTTGITKDGDINTKKKGNQKSSEELN
jgi:hypothetical protein